MAGLPNPRLKGIPKSMLKTDGSASGHYRGKPIPAMTLNNLPSRNTEGSKRTEKTLLGDTRKAIVIFEDGHEVLRLTDPDDSCYETLFRRYPTVCTSSIRGMLGGANKANYFWSLGGTNCKKGDKGVKVVLRYAKKTVGGDLFQEAIYV